MLAGPVIQRSIDLALQDFVRDAHVIVEIQNEPASRSWKTSWRPNGW